MHWYILYKILFMDKPDVTAIDTSILPYKLDFHNIARGITAVINGLLGGLNAPPFFICQCVYIYQLCKPPTNLPAIWYHV